MWPAWGCKIRINQAVGTSNAESDLESSDCRRDGLDSADLLAPIRPRSERGAFRGVEAMLRTGTMMAALATSAMLLACGGDDKQAQNPQQQQCPQGQYFDGQFCQ